MKKVLIVFFLSGLFFPSASYAQLQFGGGVELRGDGPDTGINLRIEYPFELAKYDFLTFRAGFKGSFYPTDRLDVNPPELTDEFEVLGQSYTFGGHFLAEYKAPIGGIFPYTGFGVGIESINAKVNEINRSPLEEPDPLDRFEETDTFPYFEISVGAKVMWFPLVKPFVEFRYTETLGELEDLDDRITNLEIDSNRRLVFGFMLQL